MRKVPGVILLLVIFVTLTGLIAFKNPFNNINALFISDQLILDAGTVYVLRDFFVLASPVISGWSVYLINRRFIKAPLLSYKIAMAIGALIIFVFVVILITSFGQGWGNSIL